MANAALSCELICTTGVPGKGAGGGPLGNLKPVIFKILVNFLKTNLKIYLDLKIYKITCEHIHSVNLSADQPDT